MVMIRAIRTKQCVTPCHYAAGTINTLLPTTIVTRAPEATRSVLSLHTGNVTNLLSP